MRNIVVTSSANSNSMRTAAFLSAFLCMAALALHAQSPNIQIGFPSEWPNEPSVCMNPLNPEQIMIGAVPDNYYASKDGGHTWQHGVMTSAYGVNCDPVVLADNSGNFYYFHLVPDLSRVVCHKKPGLTAPWSSESFTAVYGTYDIDKEWAAYDPVTNNLYASWSRFNTWGSSSPNDSTDIFVARSTDGGQSWGPQKLISNIGGNATGGFGSVHGSYLATGPNGEVYVTWWSPAGLMFDRSTDQGETWLNTDINITGFPVQWITGLPGIQTGVSFPVIACDLTNGPGRGNIYVTWTDKRSGANDANIWIAKSTDGGNTWSAPKRVNDDAPGRHQFFNYITVDQVTGKVYVIFYDRRNYSDSRTDVYLAISADGGETFSNYRISDSPFIPFSTLFFGHYIGVSAYNDHVFATWMRMDNGELSLWGTSIDPSTVGAETEPAIPLSLSQNTPNPFSEYTFFSFKLDKPSTVSLKVFDLLGKEVAVLISNESMAAGKHRVSFAPEKYKLPAGIYHYSLITGSKTVTKKMLYAK